MKQGILSVIVFCGLLLFTNCNREEGCLDASAVNFNPGVDKNCCCEYPNLTIRIYPQAGAVDYLATDTLYDFSGNQYLLTNVHFYLSQIKMVTADGSAIGVSDSLSFAVEDSNGNTFEEQVEDSYILMNPDIRYYETGVFTVAEDYIGLQFNIGIDSIANQATPNSFEADHPMATQDPEMFKDSLNSYLFTRAEVQIVGEAEPKVYEIYGNESLKQIKVNYEITSKQAFNTALELNVDVKALFDSVDFLTNDDNIIKQKIVSNLDFVFFKR